IDSPGRFPFPDSPEFLIDNFTHKVRTYFNIVKILSTTCKQQVQLLAVGGIAVPREGRINKGEVG
ncbi:hypothetical protein NQ318_013057, partial [Aromia moschata]